MFSFSLNHSSVFLYFNVYTVHRHNVDRDALVRISYSCQLSGPCLCGPAAPAIALSL